MCGLRPSALRRICRLPRKTHTFSMLLDFAPRYCEFAVTMRVVGRDMNDSGTKLPEPERIIERLR